MHGAMPDDTPLWTLDSVWLGTGDHVRLRGVSAVIPSGVTAVLGWSGAGKTSLLNLLVGFEKCDRGIVAGPGSVFWVPQTLGLWPHCNVQEHLEIVGGNANGAMERLDHTLAALDLVERRVARPEALSEGERSRLSVARALMSDAEVLVMDEPLVHVDPARVGNYWRAIRDHVAQTGASLIFATHEPERVLGEAQHVVCLRRGQVLYGGPVMPLYAQPETPELMNCLGPGNWLTRDEADLWLDDEAAPFGQCYRPEQIEIVPAHISHVVVRSATFRGAVAEVELHHINAAASRRFFHRPAGPALQPGTPAEIRLKE
jgi:ABC-type multidrug transport system ATPase subunit